MKKKSVFIVAAIVLLALFIIDSSMVVTNPNE